MTTAMSLGLLFIAKMADNALSTVKTIMIQRNRSLLAGVAITLSSFLYFWITRSVVLADSLLTTLTVAVASGAGCRTFGITLPNTILPMLRQIAIRWTGIARH